MPDPVHVEREPGSPGTAGPAEESRRSTSEAGPTRPEDPQTDAADGIDVREVVRYMTSSSRFVGTEENRRTGEYIAAECERIGLRPLQKDGMLWEYTQTVDGEPYEVFNVAGHLRGADGSRAVVLSAHFDSEKNTPGAVDNASGAAAVLRVADKLVSHGREPPCDVVFCWFNGEEQFYVGSAAFVEEFDGLYGEVRNVNLDCVGMRDGGLYILGISENDIARELNRSMRRALDRYDVRYGDDPNGDVYADHKSFLRRGIPAITLTQENLYSVAHTGRDTLDRIDFHAVERLCGAVAEFVLSG